MSAQKLKTSKECDDLAQQAIGTYVQACGAYGDPDSVRKVLEMLISSAALGVVVVADSKVATDILLRSCLTAAEFEERCARCARWAN